MPGPEMSKNVVVAAIQSNCDELELTTYFAVEFVSLFKVNTDVISIIIWMEASDVWCEGSDYMELGRDRNI